LVLWTPLVVDNFYMFNFKNNSSNLFIGKLKLVTNKIVVLTHIIVIARLDCFTYIATPDNRKFSYTKMIDQIYAIDNNVDLDNNFEKIKNRLSE